jgi:hypothetical protein
MEPVAVIDINIILAGVARRYRENSFVNAFTLRRRLVYVLFTRFV